MMLEQYMFWACHNFRYLSFATQIHDVCSFVYYKYTKLITKVITNQGKHVLALTLTWTSSAIYLIISTHQMKQINYFQ